MLEHDAQRTVLTLLYVMGRPCPVASLIQAAAILGLEHGALRMALSRLKSKGLVKNPERGVWTLGAGVQPMTEHVGSWRSLERRSMGWDEHSWLLCIRPPQPSRKSAAERRKLLGLTLLGFEAWQDNLWVRPHNLVLDVTGVRASLRRFEHTEDDVLTVVHHLDDGTQNTLKSLWNRQLIEQGYHHLLDTLTRAAGQTKEAPLPKVARQLYEAGDVAIRRLARDPVLPASMIDVSLRAQCIDAMRRFEHTVRTAWQQVLGIDF